jgi:hypothetical protein
MQWRKDRMGRVIDLIGKRFNKLTVVERSGITKFYVATWKCLCDCGNFKIASSANLKNGHTTSCGCRYRKRPYESLYNRLKHECDRRNNKLAILEISYDDFLQFTKIEKCHYCGNSITWREFGCGWHKRSSNTNLDRKDNSQGYTKENCVVCCRRCNAGKSSLFTYSEWYTMTDCFRNGWAL